MLRLVLKRVPILMYHRIADPPVGAMVPQHFVSLSRFGRHVLAWKRFGFSSVRLEDLLAAETWPENGIGVTFDDGYQNFADSAAPALARNNQTGTVFLVTGLLGKTNEWDTRLGDVPEQLMSAETVRSLAAQGFEFGCHTSSHSRLTELGCLEARREIGDNFLEFAEALGHEPRVFCYPYGAQNDQVRVWVQEAGFEAACSVKKGWNGQTTDRYLWRRTNVRRGTSTPLLFWKLWTQSRIATASSEY